MDKQDKRIFNILQEEDMPVSPKNLGKYLVYLKNELSFPCLLTGIEDFQWEEFYVMGPGNRNEYEKLKKTQPSYTDKFQLIGFCDDIDLDEGLMVDVMRSSDKKKFKLLLAELKDTKRKSRNYQLLDDYSVWFVNY